MSYSAIYRSIFEQLLGRSLTAKDGCSSSTALQRLPEALRDYYLTVGKVDDINQAFNVLYPPKEITSEDGYLVFMEENQGVATWGIREEEASEADPVIYQGQEDGWYSEGITCSRWLQCMAYWQAVNGGFEYCAFTETKEDVEPRVTSQWPLLASNPTGPLNFYGENGQLICVCKTDASNSIWAAGCTEEDLQSLVQQLDIEWNYCALDE